MIFDGGLTIGWSKMLRLHWHARHSMGNYRSNLKKKKFQYSGTPFEGSRVDQKLRFDTENARQAGGEVFVQIRTPFYFVK